jgi:redox-sensitive bicupin YhaK (pirin superfamily)
MIQLWVNLPAKDKMTEPKYQAITNAEFGKYNVPGDLGIVEVVAGEYAGVKGAASTFSPVQIYIGRVKKGAKLEFSTPANYNTGLVNLEGTLRINDTAEIPVDSFVLFGNDGSDFSIEALEDAMYFILSGEPLNEPIASYGPFVMNTQEEIRQAMRDFGSGKFGELE